MLKHLFSVAILASALTACVSDAEFASVSSAKHALLIRHEYGHINERLSGISDADNQSHGATGGPKWHSEGGLMDGTWEPEAKFDHKPNVPVTVKEVSYQDVNRLCGRSTFAKPTTSSGNINNQYAPIQNEVKFNDRNESCSIWTNFGKDIAGVEIIVPFSR